VPDSGDHHCFVMRPPVLEVTTWQTVKFYLPAVRSDKEEFHQDFLRAAAPGRRGLQKKEACASTHMQQGYRRELWTPSSEPFHPPALELGSFLRVAPVFGFKTPLSFLRFRTELNIERCIKIER